MSNVIQLVWVKVEYAVGPISVEENGAMPLGSQTEKRCPKKENNIHLFSELSFYTVVISTVVPLDLHS